MHTPTHAAFPILDCIPNWLACSWKLCLSRRSWTCTYIVRQQKWFGVGVPVGNSQTHGFNVSFYSCSYPYGGFPNKTIGFNKMSRSNFGWFEGTTILGKGCRIVFFFYSFGFFFWLRASSIFPWFSSIFPWFSSIFPWFSSIFPWFSMVFFNVSLVLFNFPWFSASFLWFSSINQSINIYIYMYVCMCVCMYVGR